MTTIAHHADYLCSAVSRLGSESAFEVLARAKAVEATGRRVVHMEIGEPDFDTPDHIKRAGIRAIEENYSHYTPSAGIPELREAIAAYASALPRPVAGLCRPQRRRRGRREAHHLEPAVGAARSRRRAGLRGSGLSGVRLGGELPRGQADPGPPARVAQLAARPRRARGEGRPENESRRDQLAAQSHRRRPAARGPRAHRRARAPARLLGDLRRDLLAQPLRRLLPFDLAARRHARAHDHHRRILQSIRDDGLAAGLLHRAGGDRQDGHACSTTTRSRASRRSCNAPESRR